MFSLQNVSIYHVSGIGPDYKVAYNFHVCAINSLYTELVNIWGHIWKHTVYRNFKKEVRDGHTWKGTWFHTLPSRRKNGIYVAYM